jgi:hypothetical protein
LFALRFTLITLLSFMLLSPLLRFVSRTVEKPVVLLLQDNSASILAAKGGEGFKVSWPAQLENLEKSLAENYEFRKYSFSEVLDDSFHLDYKGRETDLAHAYDALNTLYLNRNVGAVVVASDGIFNRGISPLYVKNDLQAPVFTVALGDTTVQRDLFISDLNHNQLSYLNNTFPVEVVLEARKLSGAATKVVIEKNGKVLESRDIRIDGNNWFQKLDFRFKAEETGIQRYKVSVVPVQGEFSTANNSREFFIEVLDSRQKILILADAPHPDVAALRFSMQQNENYEVETALASAFNGSLKPYSLVILHQFPSRNTSNPRIFTEIDAHQVPVLFIAGQNSNLQQFSQAQNVLQSNPSRGGFNDASPSLNRDFSLFTLDEEFMRLVNRLEPLQVPNASVKAATGASVLFQQKIGAVSTQFPLMAFSADPTQKRGVIFGEGIWRWRMQLYAETQSHSLFDAFVSRMVQYLSVRTERRNLRVVAKSSFQENEALRFEAEVYNQAYEMVNTPDVSLVITNSRKQKYPFLFSRSGNAYRLDAGLFPAGDYSYEATVNLGGKSYTYTGNFIVKPVVAELVQTRADHNLLRTWAERSGGKMLMPSQLSQLPGLLAQRESLKPVSHSEVRLEDFIHLRWVFFLLLALLSIEWFLRRRNGSY